MRNFSNRQRVDLAVLLALGVLAFLYFLDAYQASTHVYNLILVAPLTITLIALCAFTFFKELLKPSAETYAPFPIAKSLPVMLLFGAYVLSLYWLGFDVGTALFIMAFLRLHGERRWQWISAYAIVFAVGISWFFSSILPYPMPMLIFPSEF